MRVEFADTSKINIDKLLHLLSIAQGNVNISSVYHNQLLLKTDSIDTKTKPQFIKEMLGYLV